MSPAATGILARAGCARHGRVATGVLLWAGWLRHGGVATRVFWVGEMGGVWVVYSKSVEPMRRTVAPSSRAMT